MTDGHRTHQVSLVEHDTVSVCNLLHGLVHNILVLLGIKVACHVEGVHHSHLHSAGKEASGAWVVSWAIFKGSHAAFLGHENAGMSFS